MEARHLRPALGLATVLLFALFICTETPLALAQQPATAQSENFVVFAATPQWAAQVSNAAEKYRRELAIYWLGEELPTWGQRCPIHVHCSPNLGASGETTFALIRGSAGQWGMTVQGTQERVLDSVLPHEITHTIFATHFAPLGKYVPRWADEGACTTVEHEAEKSKHRFFVHKFLKTGRGLSFNNMFSLKEYPQDILPLYAQGHSAVQFLLDQGGPRKFIQFIEAGMQTEAWETELRDYYAYQTLGEFQSQWNQWLADGSPADITAYAPVLRQPALGPEVALAANTKLPQSTANPFRLAVDSGSPAPVNLASMPVGDETPVVSSPATDPLSLNAHISGLRPQSQTLDIPLAAAPASSNSSVEQLGNEGWYKRRLREVSGRPATPVPEHNTLAKSSIRAAASSDSNGLTEPQRMHQQSVARPMPKQSPGIQVLDWGDHAPLQGLQQAGNAGGNSPVFR